MSKVVYCHNAKKVNKFLGSKNNQMSFTEIKFNGDDSDIKLFKQAVIALTNTKPDKRGERTVKPIFSFGRILMKMSKNAEKFSLGECDIWIAQYHYDGTDEDRVQVVIAAPISNADFDDIDVSEFDELVNAKPSSAISTDDDDDDVLDLA